MKLNREEIIKALECCKNRECDNCIRLFNGIPSEYTCRNDLLRDALSLIKELIEENSNLHETCTELTQCCTKFETLYKIECNRVDTVKADTVRKMHSEIKERCINGGIYPAFVKSTINQIAEEMLEG